MSGMTILVNSNGMRVNTYNPMHDRSAGLLKLTRPLPYSLLFTLKVDLLVVWASPSQPYQFRLWAYRTTLPYHQLSLDLPNPRLKGTIMESPEPQRQGGDAETPNQKQARLRRERREAKIREGGTSRLEKITHVSGRQNLPGTLRLPRPASCSSPAPGMKLELILSRTKPRTYYVLPRRPRRSRPLHTSLRYPHPKHLQQRWTA